MSTSWFIVVQSTEKWWVDYEGHAFGPYDTREEAQADAVRIASHLGANLDWQVYAPDRQQRQRIVAARFPRRAGGARR